MGDEVDEKGPFDERGKHDAITTRVWPHGQKSCLPLNTRAPGRTIR